MGVGLKCKAKHLALIFGASLKHDGNVMRVTVLTVVRGVITRRGDSQAMECVTQTASDPGSQFICLQSVQSQCRWAGR